MSRTALLLFMAALAVYIPSLHAQLVAAEDFEWDPKAVYETVTVDDSTDLYILKNKHFFHFYFNDDDELTEDYLYYRKLLVNSSDAIEGLNKIYISQTTENKGLLKFRARVINPDGKTVELKEEDILTGTDEESGNEYTYFALQGLQEGSQIEYFYIKRMPPNYKGVSLDIDAYFPVARYEFDVVAPWNLVFIGKCYNTELSLERDTTLEDETRLFLHADNIKAYKDEDLSFDDANQARLIFKLDENLYSGKKDIVSYGYIAQNVVNAVNHPLEKKEEKALKKIIRAVEKYEGREKNGIARTIEDYIKATYAYVDMANPLLTNLESIYENQALNQYGALRLYTLLFKHFNVPYQVVYTTDRSQLAFDPEFHSNVFLEDLLLYLPEEEDYLDYTSPAYRIGYISAVNRHNYGLFVDEIALSEDKVVGVSEIKWIEAKPASFTIDSLQVEVHFADDFYDNTLEVKRVLTGYTAALYQPLLELITDETFKTEFSESLIKYIDAEARLEELNITHDKAHLLGVEPLQVTGKLKESLFVEKAGADYLFKVGTLIGPQTEMYEVKNREGRKHAIQTNHSRTYHRVLHFEVPEGFTLAGLEDLNIDETLEVEGEVAARFYSTFSREGDAVEVEILEFYDDVEYPKQYFEDYRKVINAAADFNKKVLLLKKV